MIKFTYFSDVKDGKLQHNIAERIRVDLQKFEGKRIELTIEKKRTKRSTSQNRLYWLYATIIANELGYSKEEMHSILGVKFLKREKVIESTGEIIPYIESTTKLTKSEFADLVDSLIKWSAETFNIVLPYPDSQIEIEIK